MKDRVKNPAYSEGSLAEHIIASECYIFAYQYFRDIQTRINTPSWIQEEVKYFEPRENNKYSIFMLEQMYSYVLSNTTSVELYQWYSSHYV